MYVGYRSGGRPAAIAADAQTTYSENEEQYCLTQQGYLCVIDQCIRKGWLAILTTADLINEQGRRRRSLCVEAPANEHFRAGSLEFSGPGYELYSEVIVNTWGIDRIDRHEAFLDRLSTSTGRVVGRTIESCFCKLSGIEQQFAGLPQRVVRSESRVIGCWRPNPFRTYQNGVELAFSIEEAKG